MDVSNKNESSTTADDAKRTQWDEWHACFTGDCPHDWANDCISELRKAARESDVERAQADARVQGLVDALGEISEGRIDGDNWESARAKEALRAYEEKRNGG